MTYRYEDIHGHARNIDSLRSARERGRVAHAYLFAGPEGVGKELVARTFIGSLLCESEGADAPCGTCRSCERVGRQVHPDVLVLEADGKFIKIDAVRGITRIVAYKPIEGAVRCVLIREADQLHEAAANALLKTLEEPSAHTIFVLTSSAPQRLLDTILSRCQVLRFGRLTHESVRRILETHEEIAAEVIPGAIGMANGSAGAALRMADEGILEKRTHWFSVLARLGECREGEMLGFGEELGKEKKEMPLYLGLIRSWFRDVMVLQAGQSEKDLTNEDWSEGLEQQAKKMSVTGVLEALSLVDEIERSLGMNVNARLAAERLFLGLYAHASGGTHA
jgi:DNA polymerase-3 subunit delta'